MIGLMIRICLVESLSLIVGCGSQTKTAPATDPEVEALKQNLAESKKQPATRTVDLNDVSSVKAFLEEELEVQLEPATLGFSVTKPGLKVEIWRLYGTEKVHEFHVIFDPLTEQAVERCLGLARRMLIASGEDPREVERKVPLGQAAFQGDDPEPVEIEFSSGAYVRFSLWVRGETYKMAGVVISPR